MQALYENLKAQQIDTGAVARVITSRAEIDMDEIKRIFKRKYGMELRDAISDGIQARDYRDFLVALVGHQIN